MIPIYDGIFNLENQYFEKHKKQTYTILEEGAPKKCNALVETFQKEP